ncbi:MAG: outer membrane protein assembly factor BamC [Candidatus Malihini olakiniferum]
MVAKVIVFSVVLLLFACSSKQRYKGQINGDESYLKSPKPKTLVTPSGMNIPVQNRDYKIQAAVLIDELSKELDIRSL